MGNRATTSRRSRAGGARGDEDEDQPQPLHAGGWVLALLEDEGEERLRTTGCRLQEFVNVNVKVNGDGRDEELS